MRNYFKKKKEHIFVLENIRFPLRKTQRIQNQF